ncbi:hypothetical protein [Paraburkholderia tropica]|uniref:hypothetical protein n=1 Tax=Paraburkholderia tropica TaxID=92647 RepID=UPI001F2F6ABD|nr:hypothetical protein [Paraburkholderia tropica]
MNSLPLVDGLSVMPSAGVLQMSVRSRMLHFRVCADVFGATRKPVSMQCGTVQVRYPMFSVERSKSCAKRFVLADAGKLCTVQT